MRETKREYISFTRWDASGMESHLEAMARRGWMLEKIGSFFWTYRRCEPKTVHFNVIFDPEVTGYTPEPSEHQQILSDFCDHAGWRLVASNAELQVFATEQAHPVPIYTDPHTRLQDLSRMAKKVTISAWFSMAVALLLLGVLLWQWNSDPLWLLLNPSNLLLLSSISLSLLVCSLTDLVTWYRWRHQAQLAAQQGELLPTRGHPFLQTVLPWLLIVVLAGTLALIPSSAKKQQLVLLVVSYAGIVLVVNGVRLWLKKKHMDADENRNITFVVDLVLTIALIVPLISVSDRTGEVIPQDTTPPLLAVQDLTGTEDPAYASNSYTKSSLFLSQVKSYQFVPTDDGEPATLPELSYTLYDIHVSLAYSPCLHKALASFDWALEDHPGLAFEAHPAPEGVDALYVLNQSINDCYPCIFCWEDRIVELYPSWSLTEEQVSIAGAALAP